jgi:hypothetical protein
MWDDQVTYFLEISAIFAHSAEFHRELSAFSHANAATQKRRGVVCP